MVSGGEGPKVCSAVLFNTYAQALSCKNEREEATKKPFHVASKQVGFATALVAYSVEEGYVRGCESKEKKFDSLLGNNEALAKECAASLSLLEKGKQYVAVKLGDGAWQVFPAQVGTRQSDR